MNGSKYIFKPLLLTLFLAISSLFVNAQKNDAEKEEAIKSLIESKNFVFEAQNAIPTRGITRPLSFGYDFQIFGDSAVAHLPYFGQAYSVTYGGQGGIRFNTSEFGYKVKQKSKGWDITITPKDIRDVRQMLLSISNSGYATLQVMSNFRDPITFRGEITKKRKKS